MTREGDEQGVTAGPRAEDQDQLRDGDRGDEGGRQTRVTREGDRQG